MKKNSTDDVINFLMMSAVFIDVFESAILEVILTLCAGT